MHTNVNLWHGSMTVRLIGAQRRRSWVWWGVIAFALLAIGAYVLFDILDVDGSQMTGWPAGDIIVAWTPQVEADRLLRADLSTADPTGLISLSLRRCSSIEDRGLSPAAAILRVRQSRLLPRMNLHRETARAGSPSIDPV
jgi:hypothetical protein